jgi:colanic acid/amylovoran biosynthesis glycosyltransferase
MTIAWILDTFPSLTETFIARDIAALRQRGAKVEIFALKNGEGAHPIQTGFLDQARRAFQPAVSWQTVGERLGREIAQGRFASLGISHIHGGWASHPAEIAQGAARTAKLSWSFSGHARDLWVDGRNWEDKLETARFAAVCTRAGESFLCQQAPAFESKILYTPHGLDLTEYPFTPRILSRGLQDDSLPFKIVSVGRLVPKKGWPLLLEAIALLRTTGFESRLEIIGEGPERENLQCLIRDLSLSDAVRLSGALALTEVRSAMREADCLAFAGVTAPDGDRDGLPNVLLEAAALGVPIVASDIGGVRDLGGDEVQELCKPGSARALADGIAQIFEHPKLSARRVQAARLRVEKQFDLQRTGAELWAAFHASEGRG